MEYVTGEESSARAESPPEPVEWQPGADHACFLCRAAAKFDAQAEADRKLLVAARGRNTLVVLNRYPYNNGHLMVAPRRHVASPELLTRDERAALGEVVTASLDILRRAFNPAGFNLGANLGRVAGAGIADHLHWHAVPR